MGTAYTPGLTVSANTIVLKTRRLPIKGEVLVNEGDTVEPDTVVARALLPGILQTVRAAQLLGIEPKQLPDVVKVKEGDAVEKDQILAETKGFFRAVQKVRKAPVKGTVEFHLARNRAYRRAQSRRPSVDVRAYVQGRVVKVACTEGAVIETQGAFIQGIFGVGGERRGELKVMVQSPRRGDRTPHHQRCERQGSGGRRGGGKRRLPQSRRTGRRGNRGRRNPRHRPD